MRNNIKRNTRIKLISLFTSIVLWMYVMAIVDPEDTKLFENIPVNITNAQELEDNDLVVYPQSNLVGDIYITGKLSDLQKISEKDIHMSGSINNPVEGQNYLYLKVNLTKQLSYEFKNDFIIVKLEKLIHKEVDINPYITGDYKSDVDSVTLQQSSINISAPRVLVEQVDHIKANVDVNNKDGNQLTQKVKLVAVNSKGEEIDGVNLETRYITAQIKFLEEKEVPVNIQLNGDLENIEAYEILPKTVIIKGKKDDIDKIDYINTNKIDILNIEEFEDVDLIIPKNITSDQTSVEVKIKDKESLVKRLIYKKDDIKIINNSQYIKIDDLGIPDNINVEVYLDDINRELSKSDIELYIDLENNYDEKKEYTINYKSDMEFKNINIIPNRIKK